MITLNLLPPEEKLHIESVQAQRKIFGLGGAVLFFALIFLAFLFSIWLLLSIQLDSANSIYDNIQASSQNAEFKKLESEVSRMNEKLRLTEESQKRSNHYSFVLEKLTESASPDIKFAFLSISQNKGNLGGRAVSRESLLSFKDALSQSPYFDKIDMPLSNFLKQTDIDFSVNFEIK